ncbi:unnamed protein product [Adineta steineri]|uniref:Uncharacterized protein n=1 Tax=Adineta steineri TaxID=433720 RepID=A0A814SKF9_9BILA|nr:unnamed protein product [Adineta steineri]CAF1148826.1 unnamed protein product [Adineta steineri]
MQQSPDVQHDSEGSEIKPANENNDDIQAPPPSYPSVIHKLEQYTSQNHDHLPPPNYYDVNNPSVVYINNYPGPPLTDGTVQIVSSYPVPQPDGVTMRNFLSTRMRIFLTINGIITILFGIATIGIQVGLLVSHSIVYYYYGFWAGILIISIGIGTIVFNNRYRTYDLAKYFRSSLWQIVFIAVVFGFGIIIILTDTCDKKDTDDEGDDDTCKTSYKVLNGLLIAIIALTFLQSIINTCIIAFLKRRYYTSPNTTS